MGEIIILRGHHLKSVDLVYHMNYSLQKMFHLNKGKYGTQMAMEAMVALDTIGQPGAGIIFVSGLDDICGEHCNAQDQCESEFLKRTDKSFLDHFNFQIYSIYPATEVIKKLRRDNSHWLYRRL